MDRANAPTEVDVDVDVAVVGGGPVGLATAIQARLAGLSVCLLERRAEPPDKACGEGLMPAGVAALQRMGVSLGPHERYPMRGICYIDGPWTAHGQFARGEAGWGVRRLVLVRALLARAQGVGVDVRLGCAVQRCAGDAHGVQVQTPQGAVRARWLVGADGLHSKVRVWAGLQAAPGRPRRFGVRRHFAMVPWGERVEVHWQRGVEAYVTPVSPQQVNIAFLWEGGQATFPDLLRRFPALEARVHGVPFTSAVRGAGPFEQVLARRTASRVALVGDAAGYLDALTGEGLTLGFHSGAALAEVLARDLPLSHYERAYTRLSADYYRSTRALLAVSRHPWLRRALVMALARVPGAFDRLLAWHGQGTAPELRCASPAGS